MALKVPLFCQAAGGDTAVSYAALDYRSSLVGALIRTEGVIDRHLGGLRVSQRGAGANFTVDIAAGITAVQGDDVSGQGKYACESTAVENRTIAAPPGSGTRIHRVIARVNDKLHNGALPANTYTFTLEVLVDTGAGTPATPNSAISLATVSVTAGQASVLDSHITDTRPWAYGPQAENGVLPLASGWASGGAGLTPSYRLTADGWVFFSGQVLRTGANLAGTANVFYPVTTALPPQIRPITVHGGVVLARENGAAGAVYITTDQTLSIEHFTTTTIVQNSSWFYLNGMCWKL